MKMLGNMLSLGLVLLAFTAIRTYGAESVTNQNRIVDGSLKERIDEEDHIAPEDIARIRTKVEQMSDEELAGLISSVMPHERSKRTIGTVRRCIEKVRCLFTSLKRSKRQTSASSILRAISKLTSIASDAANELLGKGLGGQGFSLANLFKNTKSPTSSSSSSSLAEALASSFNSGDNNAASSDSDDGEAIGDSSAEGSDIVEEKACDQRCNLSILMYRRLRRLLKNL